MHLSRAYAEDRPLLITQEEGGTRIGRGDEFRLAMVEGYRSPEQLREQFPLARLQLHPSRFSALAAVSLGHADVFLGNALGSRYVLGRSQLAAVEEIDAALPSQGIGFAMLEDGGPLPRLVNAALASLSERQRRGSASAGARWPAPGTSPSRCSSVPPSNAGCATIRR